MRLPDGDRAEVPDEKLTGYLLSESHPIGRWKSDFFARFGYTARNAAALRGALLKLAAESEVTETVATPHGTKFVVDGYIVGAAGSRVGLRTIWITPDVGSRPRFVTAYPL